MNPHPHHDPPTLDDRTLDPSESAASTTNASDAEGALLDRLAEEFAARIRRGEHPAIAEYQRRHPELADQIQELLPSVALLERLKTHRPPPGDSEEAVARPLPERVGEFRVVRELGRGGMGVVYEAFQESLDRTVALKVIPHHGVLDERRLRRFRREAQAVARLHHTNIVPIFGVGESEGVPYYAMQYIRGIGLDKLLDSWRASPPRQGLARWRMAANIGVQAADALQYAHEQGILHRDIKPANLLIDAHEAVWVTDFGLAKLAGREDLTASGDVIGTLRYLAPEALQGESGPQGDVYSLGLTLYELLTLSPAFGDSAPSELLRRVSEGRPTRPRRLEPGIPRDLETIVLKAIARESDQRYPNAGALAEDLRRYLEDRPIHARRASPLERSYRWGRRNKIIAALLTTSTASLLLAAVVGWSGYVTTQKALKGESDRRKEAEAATIRADENVALSLEVFGELFNKLAPRGSTLPPPPGRSGRRPPPDEGGPPPDEGGPQRGGPPRNDPLGLFGPDGPPPDAPPEHSTGTGREGGPGRRGPGGPGGPGGGRRATASDTELLTSILTFYDRFGRRNEANPVLQGEAARAYFKVGTLHERLGRDADAEAALARALAILEDLIRRYPQAPQYPSLFIEVVIESDPWTVAPGRLERLANRLKRARDLADALAAASPNEPDPIQAQVHVHAKLGTTLRRLGHPSDAEASYRTALDLATDLIAKAPGTNRPRLDRSDIREALAELLNENHRVEDARSLLEDALADLNEIPTRGRTSRPMTDRLERIAEAFTDLGDSARAAQVTNPGSDPPPPESSVP